MGSCATSSKRPKNKKSGSLTTYQDSPNKKYSKSSQVDEKQINQQVQIHTESDPYFTRYRISQEDFKEHATSKSQEYYKLFYKFKMLSDQIGEIDRSAVSSSLFKHIQKLKLISEKIDRDFKINQYKRSSQNLPIISEEVLIYTYKYAQVMVEVFNSLEKDAKYEELFPILSFSFKDMKNQLSDIIAEADKVRASSSLKLNAKIQIDVL